MFATVSYDAFGEMFVLKEAVMLSVTSKFLAKVNLLSKLRRITGNPAVVIRDWLGAAFQLLYRASSPT